MRAALYISSTWCSAWCAVVTSFQLRTISSVMRLVSQSTASVNSIWLLLLGEDAQGVEKAGHNLLGDKTDKA